MERWCGRRVEGMDGDVEGWKIVGVNGERMKEEMEERAEENRGW